MLLLFLLPEDYGARRAVPSRGGGVTAGRRTGAAAKAKGEWEGGKRANCHQAVDDVEGLHRRQGDK